MDPGSPARAATLFRAVFVLFHISPGLRALLGDFVDRFGPFEDVFDLRFGLGF
jgi:hypothetical protein